MSSHEISASLAVNLELRNQLEYHAHHGAFEVRPAMREAAELARRHTPILLEQYSEALRAELPAEPVTSDEQKPAGT